MEKDDFHSIKTGISRHLKEGNLKLVIDQLNALKSWKATAEELKTTRIGVFVTDVRKHDSSNDDIKRISREIVGKWKNDIGRSDTPTTKRKSITELSNNSEGTVSNDASGQSSVVSIERNVSIDQISVKGISEKVRVKCTEIFALASGTAESSKIIMEICQKVEKAAYNHFKSGNEAYKSRIRSLVANLRDKNNTDLKHRVISREIEPEKFAMMSPEELMSKDRQAIVQEAQKQNLADALTVKPMHSATDIFKCGKCKQRKTTYYQMQTRSADEPMTTFVTCLVCDNRWKFC